MKRAYHIRFIVVLISCLLISASSYAAANTVNGWYGITAVSGSGLDEIYGDYLKSESYSRLDTVEDYDPGYLEDFWGWHLRSETEVSNSQGTVTAFSQTTAPVGAFVGVGEVSLDLNESLDASAWTNTQSVYTSDADKTVDLSFYHDTNLDLSAELSGSVNYYFGIWENEMTTGNFMLSEQDGWALADLDYQGQNYLLLKKTYLSNAAFLSDTTEWVLDFAVGQDYNFFTYIVADVEIVPEPCSLALLGLGGVLIRRKK